MRILATIPLSKDKVILRVAGVAIITLFFIAARLYNPFESQLIVCQFKQLTGHDCPTCGLARSTFSLMHLHLGDSIKFNPLGVVLVGGLLVLLLKFLIELLLQREIEIPGQKIT
jgi:hypothetical protein